MCETLCGGFFDVITQLRERSEEEEEASCQIINQQGHQVVGLGNHVLGVERDRCRARQVQSYNSLFDTIV